MTSPASSLLADLGAIERHAAAGGADDKLLARAIERLVLLCMGVPVGRVDALLRVQALRRSGVSVTTACRSAGLSRDAYYRLLQILQHHPCEPPASTTCWRNPVTRIVKTTPISAPDTLTPPQQSNGKPTWQAPQTPRADGGMSTGKTGGNFAAGTTPPNATPAELLDKPGTGSV